MPSLKGAKIELTNNSAQPIFYQGKWTAPHEAVTTVETNELGEATVKDVKYEGLTPGEEYEITGTLYETKQIQDGTAEPVAQGTVRFKASASSDEASVPFSVRTASLEGKEVTAYETITKDGQEVASHTDSHSKAQTIRVASKPQLPNTADNTFTAPLLLALTGLVLIGCTHLLATKLKRFC